MRGHGGRAPTSLNQGRGGRIGFPRQASSRRISACSRPRPTVSPTRQEDGRERVDAVGGAGRSRSTHKPRGGGRAPVRDKNCICAACQARTNNPSSIPSRGDKAPSKQHLRQKLLSDPNYKYWTDPPGDVNDDNRPLFHLYPYERFRSNLSSLKKTIGEERDRLEFDLVAVQKESKAPLDRRGQVEEFHFTIRLRQDKCC